MSLRWYFFEGWGLGEVGKKAEIVKNGVCGASFTRLEGFCCGCEEGVRVFEGLSQ